MFLFISVDKREISCIPYSSAVFPPVIVNLFQLLYWDRTFYTYFVLVFIYIYVRHTSTPQTSQLQTKRYHLLLYSP
jgi:hypothetical protein